MPTSTTYPVLVVSFPEFCALYGLNQDLYIEKDSVEECIYAFLDLYPSGIPNYSTETLWDPDLLNSVFQITRQADIPLPNSPNEILRVYDIDSKAFSEINFFSWN